jgi:hypothetical protein
MFSVPRYHVLIVVAYLALAVVLALTTVRPAPANANDRSVTGSVTASRLGGAAALTACGVLVATVPSFSYLPGPRADAVRLTVALAGVLGALAVALPWRRGADAALALAATAYVSTAAASIRLDPAPRIDVWYILQGAADGLRHGENLYDMVLVGPPGRMAAFTYLPGTAVLLAPGRWLAGDVRWALVIVTLCTAAGFVAFTAGRTGTVFAPGQVITHGDPAGRSARVAAALLLLLPGTLTQVEQAWTEPLLLGCLTGAMLALTRGRGRWAVLGVALALASKQHVVLLLPVLAAWPRFGVRRALAAAVTAGVLVLPWFVTAPASMWHDTVRLLVDFPPLRFADTAYIAVLNEFGVRLPFWLTGAAVLATVTAATVAVHRRDPDPALVLRWCALVLFVANLVNKQAFYNQYWLVAGLVLASWAVTAAPRPADLS